MISLTLLPKNMTSTQRSTTSFSYRNFFRTQSALTLSLVLLTGLLVLSRWYSMARTQELEASLSTLNVRYAQTSATYSRQNDLLQKAKDKHEQQEKLIEELERTVSARVSEAKEIETKLEMVGAERDQFKKEYIELNGKLESIMADYDELQASEHDCEDALVNNGRALDLQNQKKTELEVKLNDQKSQLESLQSQLRKINCAQDVERYRLQVLSLVQDYGGPGLLFYLQKHGISIEGVNISDNRQQEREKQETLERAPAPKADLQKHAIKSEDGRKDSNVFHAHGQEDRMVPNIPRQYNILKQQNSKELSAMLLALKPKLHEEKDDDVHKDGDDEENKNMIGNAPPAEARPFDPPNMQVADFANIDGQEQENHA